MKKIFADTNGIIALLNEDDELHESAQHAYDRLRISSPLQLILTDYIIAEFCNAFSKKLLRQSAIDFLSTVSHSSIIQLVKINDEHIDKSIALYKLYSDKEWSLTDCTSFIVMQELQIIDAFTHDKHFEQAGFTRLIK